MQYIAIVALALALAACGQDDRAAPEPAATQPVPSAVASAPPAPGDPAAERPQLSAEAQKGEEGARAVLLEWARALERKDFATARSLLRDDAANVPGLAEQLGGLRTIAVAAPLGRMEGAAGSLYYQAPVTVAGRTDGGTRIELQGPVVLRRANDVPGATAEQVRWRIESAQLKPVN